MLETLFDMRAVLYEIRDALIDSEDGDEDTEEDACGARSRGGEAERSRRRLLEMVESYKELNARRRPAGPSRET